MNRRAIAVVITTASAFALSGCGSDSGSNAKSNAPSVSMPSSTSSASSSTRSASSTTTVTVTQSPSQTGTSAGANSAAATSTGKQGALDTRIRQQSFDDLTFRTNAAGTVTLKNGMATVNNNGGPQLVGLQGTKNTAGTRSGYVYGDVNGDGIEDAIVELDVQQGNGVSIEFSVWLGQKMGTPQQVGTPFLILGRCGISVDSTTIGADGLITLKGRGLGQSCSETGQGAPYTATYRVVDNAVKTITAPPAI